MKHTKIQGYKAEIHVSHLLNATATHEAIKHAYASLAYKAVDQFLASDAQSLILTRPQATVRIKDSAEYYTRNPDKERHYDSYVISGYGYGKNLVEDTPIHVVKIEEIAMMHDEFYARTGQPPTHLFVPPHCRVAIYGNILSMSTRPDDPITGAYGFQIVENAPKLAVGIL